MERTPKLWTAKQAHDYNGKNAISEFLVKRKLPVSPPIKKQGCRRPKKKYGRKNMKPPTIYVDRDSISGDHHVVQCYCHGHGRGRLLTEGTKRSLTGNNVDSGIESRRDGSAHDDMPSTMKMEATPSTSIMTNCIVGSTEHNHGGSQNIN